MGLIGLLPVRTAKAQKLSSGLFAFISVSYNDTKAYGPFLCSA
jgi:hypothetical protein